jgi:DNA-binding CsgD family transcriptional regulator
MLSERVYRQSGLALTDRATGPALLPPFSKLALDVLWVGFHIDRAAVRRFVPDPLRLTDASIGILGLYQAPTGSGLAPYCRGLVGVSVEGQPGSGIGEGMYVLGSVMDEPGASRMRQLYSNPTIAGTARTELIDGVLMGEASVNGEAWLRASVRPRGPVMRDRTGVDTFFGLSEAGLIQHVDSNGSDIIDAEALSVEITDSSPDYMRALRPLDFVFALHATKVNSVWSEPRLVGRSAAADRPPGSGGEFLDLIEESGRAAAIVRADGTLIATNGSARRLLGPHGGQRGDVLLKGTAAERLALQRALSMSFARKGPRVTDPVALSGPEGGVLLAHVLPLDHGAVPDRALVLLTDPHGPERHDATRILQLFGLTLAEARLAALIGSGQDTRAAATQLSITPHTARSTMKAVYDKLGIRKQSELGHFVARLQHF